MSREIHLSMKEAKQEVLENSKFNGDVSVAVKVLNQIDSYTKQEVFDIEVNIYLSDMYENCTVVESFWGEDMESEAVKRAKAILKSVKGWFDCTDVEVQDDVEVYTL